MSSSRKYDVIILGAGFAGMASACRLQAAGLSTLVLEVHDKPGGCAGYYTRNGFSFDIGATTLVDFEPGGVGGQFLDQIGLTNLKLEYLPGYQAWLPDRTITLHREPDLWKAERTRLLGDTGAHQRLWSFLDRLAEIFWPASAKGVRLPVRSFSDIKHNIQSVGWRGLPASRFLFTSLGDTLRNFNLEHDKPLTGLLSMLCEDTLHARNIFDAPVINAALGTSIRSRIARPIGGMMGFWSNVTDHYTHIGGDLRLKTKVVQVDGRKGAFTVKTRRGDFQSGLVINTIALPHFETITTDRKLQGLVRKYITRDSQNYGAGIVLCLGVPEAETAGQQHRHHQLLQDYDSPLGDGNNMFISVSREGDDISAPSGFRSVMISTHTEIDKWRNLGDTEYNSQKQNMQSRLLDYARRVYPELGSNPVVFETGTPVSYSRFARRPVGAVGGVRINMRNSNQWAMPHDPGRTGIFFAGDYTWPGLGSVACLLGSRIVTEKILSS